MKYQDKTDVKNQFYFRDHCQFNMAAKMTLLNLLFDFQISGNPMTAKNNIRV